MKEVKAVKSVRVDIFSHQLCARLVCGIAARMPCGNLANGDAFDSEVPHPTVTA